MKKKQPPKLEPNLSGVSGQYLVAAELSRRGLIASPTLRNTRGVDVLAANSKGTKTVSIQVKTNQGSNQEWLLSKSAEELVSPTLFYVFVNLNGHGNPATFHVVESKTVAGFIRRSHTRWLSKSKRDGTARVNTSMRKFDDWDKRYLDAWHRLGII